MGQTTCDNVDVSPSRQSDGVIPAVHLIVWGLLCGWLLLGVPRYLDLFADFGIEVSSGSRQTAQLAAIAHSYWPFVLAGLGGLWFVSSRVDAALARRHYVQLRKLWLIAGIAIPLITVAVTFRMLEDELGLLINGLS